MEAGGVWSQGAVAMKAAPGPVLGGDLRSSSHQTSRVFPLAWAMREARIRLLRWLAALTAIKNEIAENKINEVSRPSFATDCNPGASEHRMSSIQLAFLKPVS